MKKEQQQTCADRYEGGKSEEKGKLLTLIKEALGVEVAADNMRVSAIRKPGLKLLIFLEFRDASVGNEIISNAKKQTVAKGRRKEFVYQSSICTRNFKCLLCES